MQNSETTVSIKKKIILIDFIIFQGCLKIVFWIKWLTLNFHFGSRKPNTFLFNKTVMMIGYRNTVYRIADPPCAAIGLLKRKKIFFDLSLFKIICTTKKQCPYICSL